MHPDRFDPGAGPAADSNHRHPGRDRFELRLKWVGVVEIHLGQHDHRGRPALMGDGQESLDAAQVEVGVRGGGDKDKVHVGRDDLRGGFAARRLPGDGRLPPQNGPNLGRFRRVVDG